MRKKNRGECCDINRSAGRAGLQRGASLEIGKYRREMLELCVQCMGTKIAALIEPRIAFDWAFLMQKFLRDCGSRVLGFGYTWNADAEFFFHSILGRFESVILLYFHCLIVNIILHFSISANAEKYNLCIAHTPSCVICGWISYIS